MLAQVVIQIPLPDFLDEADKADWMTKAEQALRGFRASLSGSITLSLTVPQAWPKAGQLLTVWAWIAEFLEAEGCLADNDIVEMTTLTSSAQASGIGRLHILYGPPRQPPACATALDPRPRTPSPLDARAVA
jgi:hypothetical protein